MKLLAFDIVEYEYIRKGVIGGVERVEAAFNGICTDDVASFKSLHAQTVRL